MVPETTATIARRLGLPADEVQVVVDRMAERGQIFSFRKRGRRFYSLAPFVIGIYEFQLEHLDREFAEQSITRETLDSLTDRIGRANGRLRAVHLSAHLETARVLTMHQRHMYDRLRGYSEH